MFLLLYTLFHPVTTLRRVEIAPSTIILKCCCYIHKLKTSRRMRMVVSTMSVDI